MFSVLPAILISSTYTDKKSPLARLANKHFQFKTFPNRVQMQSDSMRRKNSSQQRRNISRCSSRLGHNPFFFLILNPLRHCGAAYQAGILSAQSGAEMADIERMQKIVPLITCEISLCQYVCELVLGVSVFDLDLGVQTNPVKQPIQSNSVGP